MPAAASKAAARQPPLPIRAYLILFNLTSFFLWTLLLATAVKHLAMGPQTPSIVMRYADQVISPLRGMRVFVIPELHSYKLPPWLLQVLSRATTLHQHVGGLLCFTQSLAVLEVVHAGVGLVRSPVVTTAIQVASRLWLTWGVSERYHQASSSPFFASMLLAWSITECIRYPFYANALMGADSPFLLWCRYTFFYVLYPVGAISEAALMWATLPETWFWEKTTTGRGVVGGGGSVVASEWTPRDFGFLALFVLWWPGLYVMYTHMIRQRKRALGFWGDEAISRKMAEMDREARRKKALQDKSK